MDLALSSCPDSGPEDSDVENEADVFLAYCARGCRPADHCCLGCRLRWSVLWPQSWRRVRAPTFAHRETGQRFQEESRCYVGRPLRGGCPAFRRRSAAPLFSVQRAELPQVEVLFSPFFSQRLVELSTDLGGEIINIPKLSLTRVRSSYSWEFTFRQCPSSVARRWTGGSDC